jgi:polysaccharide biosynthesis/export protein
MNSAPPVRGSIRPKLSLPMWLRSICLVLVSCAWLAGQSGKQTEAGYVLGPGDVLSVQVRDAEEITDRKLRIDVNGDLRLPFVGSLHVAGLTISQCEQALEARLRKYFAQPDAVVQIVEFQSQPVSVMGAVRNPGVVQIQGRKTLVEVLSTAGGLRDDAGNKLKIARRLEAGPIPLPGAAKDETGQYTTAEVSLARILDASNPAGNIRVMANDVITVPVADIVYVLGEVKKPGGFVLRNEERVSALMALSMAEGPLRNAAAGKARILRRRPGQSERAQLKVDLKKMMSGKAADMGLEAGDILVVPNSMVKAATFRSVESAIAVGTGILIWRR